MHQTFYYVEYSSDFFLLPDEWITATSGFQHTDSGSYIREPGVGLSAECPYICDPGVGLSNACKHTDAGGLSNACKHTDAGFWLPQISPLLRSSLLNDKQS